MESNLKEESYQNPVASLEEQVKEENNGSIPFDSEWDGVGYYRGVNLKTVQPYYVFEGNLGSIELIKVYGNETDIINAARASYEKESLSFSGKDRKLLKYLVKNKHTSPLEFVDIVVRVKAPKFVRTQWVRHRTGMYNDKSFRYTGENITWIEQEKFREQSKTNKQSSHGRIKESVEKAIAGTVQTMYGQCMDLYEDMVAHGVAREQARQILPDGVHTSFMVKMNLNNMMKFLALRNHPHAQLEIRVYAKAIEQFIREKLPVFYEVWKEVQDEAALAANIFLQQKEFRKACGSPCNEKMSVTYDLRPQELDLCNGLITEEYKELMIETSKYINSIATGAIDKEAGAEQRIKSLAGIAKEGIDLIYVVLEAFNLLGIDGMRMWNIVHKSNMSKVGKDGKVTRNKKGKIMKPEGYVSPLSKIEDIVRKEVYGDDK